MSGQVLAEGALVERYRIEGVLGEGGMATVYRVRHLSLGSVHALKVLTLSSPTIRARLRQEGRFQARLSHPNIVAVTDVIELGDDTPGLVMEFVDGPTLEQLLQDGPLTVEEAEPLVVGILAGVAEAHRHGLVHRDLKPSNVLLKPIGGGYLPKVADFGLAKALASAEGGRTRTRTGTSMGTPNYMSPEQARDPRNVAHSSDIFSLGAIFYEMLSGRRAFDGEDLLSLLNAVAEARYEPLRTWVPAVPRRIQRAITSALSVDPADRPQDVAQLAVLWSSGVLEDVRGPPVVPISLEPAVPIRSPSPDSERTTRLLKIADRDAGGSWRWLLGGLVLVVLGGAAIGGAAWWRTQIPATVPLAAAAPPTIPPPDLTLAPATVVAEPVVPPAESAPPRASSPAPRTPAVVPEEPAAEPPSAAANEEMVRRVGRLAPAERRALAESVGKGSDDASLRLLIYLVRNDRDPAVRSAAATALVAHYREGEGNGAILEPIVRWIAGRASTLDATAAVRALEQVASDPNVLLVALHHDDLAVRIAAVQALPAISARAPEADVSKIRAWLGAQVDPALREEIAKLPAALQPAR